MLTILGITDDHAGMMRAPYAGSEASEIDERMVIQLFPGFAGNVNVPVNVAPAARRIWSPGCAAFRAVCRSPPAGT